MPTEVKPHMRRRPGETIEQYHARLGRSCYRCGTEIHDRAELNEHEDNCTGPKSGRGAS
ncbi:hypothetical protein [Saccharopolyspora taberi]